MMRKTTLATLAILAGSGATPAAAQWFQQWDQDGLQPFWEQRAPNTGPAEQVPRGPSRGAGNSSGGARPTIVPAAPETVAFDSNFTPNSIVIDSSDRKLYFIVSPTEAYRYPIAVGRDGFDWTGTEVISAKQQWPDWYPPKEMIARDRRLPEKMSGGIRNPLGALALYLGKTLYRIHGTNDESSIGEAASSGCFRMMNGHIVHLASIAEIGTPVTVLKSLPAEMTQASAADDEQLSAKAP
jgi:lipoprotein-anchoring transpeptidase ErfK/SrfK